MYVFSPTNSVVAAMRPSAIHTICRIRACRRMLSVTRVIHARSGEGGDSRSSGPVAMKVVIWKDGGGGTFDLDYASAAFHDRTTDRHVLTPTCRDGQEEEVPPLGQGNQAARRPRRRVHRHGRDHRGWPAR